MIASQSICGKLRSSSVSEHLFGDVAFTFIAFLLIQYLTVRIICLLANANTMRTLFSLSKLFQQNLLKKTSILSDLTRYSPSILD